MGGAVTALGAAGFVLIGCGGSKQGGLLTPGPTGATGQPVRGGTLRTSYPSSILSLDPHNAEGLLTAADFYSYVIHATDWKGNVGDLAESWEMPDDVTWTFKIRNDVRFQNVAPANGRALVAGDIVKSYDRMKSMPGVPQAWTDWIIGYSAPDDYTFSLTTRDPRWAVLLTLGSPIAAIVPVEAADSLSTQVVGSGPFMLTDYRPNDGVSMVRNPTYYQDYPYVDGQSIKVITDDATVQAAFRSGQIDVYNATNKPSADAVKDVSGASTQKYLQSIYMTFILNGSKLAAFKDERVREAVDLALDRNQMIEKICFGDGELAGPIPPSGGNEALPKEEIEAAYTRDVSKAKSLLSAAGADGLSFTLTFVSSPDQADLASLIKSNLAEAGITANLAERDQGTWISEYYSGSFEATLMQQLPYLGSDFSLAFHQSRGFSNSEAFNYGVDDPQVDSMIENAQTILDEQQRINTWLDVQRLILKRHGPTLTLYQPYAYWVAMDFIKGYTPTANGFGLFKYDYWIDKG